MPVSHLAGPILRQESAEALVPTLVTKRNGEVIYGLREGDFLLEDNGVAQKIHVQEEMDTAPVALAIVVEQGRSGALEFDTLARLGPLLESFLLADGCSQAALIGFDSTPHLLVDYTHASGEIDAALRRLEPGDGGAAILDTVGYAVDLLAMQPREYRRVLLLVSEERDHGSRHIQEAELIRKLGSTDVLVLSVSFSASRAELLHDAKDAGEDRRLNLLSPLFMLVQALRKNVARELATMSGGEYNAFTLERGFEEKVLQAARHARNRYLLTFRPSDPTPGLHTIRVRLRPGYEARVVARANYWLQSGP